MSSPPTRISATETAYDQRAKQLIVLATEYISSTHNRSFEPGDLIEYLESRRSDLAHASWRQYKSALVWFSRQQACRDGSWLCIAEQLALVGWSAKAKPKRQQKRTSAKKLKNVSRADIIRLRTQLSLSDSLAAAFVTAAWITGLRPTEWQRARLETKGTGWRLIVQNAKRTNGRSHGPQRTLHFDSLDFNTLFAIRCVIEAFDKVGDAGVDALKERLERAFRTANNALWPRRKMNITLYSLRHACAARLKLDFSAVEVAALMGHCTDTTAFTHYARARKEAAGRLQSVPKPDPDDVTRVRLVKNAELERLATVKSFKATRPAP